MRETRTLYCPKAAGVGWSQYWCDVVAETETVGDAHGERDCVEDVDAVKETVTVEETDDESDGVAV